MTAGSVDRGADQHTQREHAVGRDRPRISLEREFPDALRLDGTLDRGEDALAHEDLARPRFGRETLREVRYVPDGAVVVAALETDAAERRVPHRDPRPETERVPALLPLVELPGHPLAHADRSAHRAHRVVLLRDGIVEPDHHAVPSKVFERPLVTDHRGPD